MTKTEKLNVEFEAINQRIADIDQAISGAQSRKRQALAELDICQDDVNTHVTLSADIAACDAVIQRLGAERYRLNLKKTGLEEDRRNLVIERENWRLALEATEKELSAWSPELHAEITVIQSELSALRSRLQPINGAVASTVGDALQKLSAVGGRYTELLNKKAAAAQGLERVG